MQLLNSPFGSTAHALSMTLKEAKRRGDKEIIIPKGEYSVHVDEAESCVACVSNHGHNGYKAAALCIEDFDGLTVDCSGSSFLLKGCMDFAIIKNSRNVTLKNLTVTCRDSCNFQGRVLESSTDKVVIELEDHPKLYLHGNTVFQKFGNDTEAMGRTLDYVTETRELRRGSGDENFGKKFNDIEKTLDGEILTLFDVPTPPPVGDTIVFTMSRRCNQAFFVSNSENITLSDITVNTCWGMAFMVQKTKDITIEKCRVTPEGDRCWSAGQDATHFVNCRGLVTVRDSVFENQLDDAVNLHGIYTRVQKVSGDSIFARYSHFQSVGIDIYSAGDKLQFMMPEDQMPTAYAEVDEVEVQSLMYTSLKLKNITGEIKEGMICENLSDEADAVIENNIIRNNRARGMLIAAKGHIEIRSNHFHSGGAAIQFESDPFRWYECGGTRDVVIKGNFFDDCKHGRWSRAVIDINKRRETVDGFYYHGRIEISDNRFTQTNSPCVAADNVADLVFAGNTYEVDEPVVACHAKGSINGESFSK